MKTRPPDDITIPLDVADNFANLILDSRSESYGGKRPRFPTEEKFLHPISNLAYEIHSKALRLDVCQGKKKKRKDALEHLADITNYGRIGLAICLEKFPPEIVQEFDISPTRLYGGSSLDYHVEELPKWIKITRDPKPGKIVVISQKCGHMAVGRVMYCTDSDIAINLLALGDAASETAIFAKEQSICLVFDGDI